MAKQSVADAYKKETDYLAQLKETDFSQLNREEKENILSKLVKQHEKLLKETIKITKIGDILQKNLLEANIKLDEEIYKAKQVHEQMLPKELPSIENISMDAYNQSAETIGADFYDLHRIDDSLFFYLSDVSGHGLDGAMLSVFVKSTISDYLDLKCNETTTPGQVVRYLAEKYYKNGFPPDYFICLYMAMLNLQTGEMTCSAVGFQTAPLAVIDGQKKMLTIEGLPISTAFGCEFLELEELKLTLKPGDTILFTTDGLAEQLYQDTLYEQRLNNLFFNNYHLPPARLSAIIQADFRDFNGGKTQAMDDITYMILQMNR